MPLQTQVLWRRSTLCACLGAAATVCISLFGCSGDSPTAPHPAGPKPTYEVTAIACSYAQGNPKVVCAQYAHSDSRTLAGAVAELRGHPAPKFVAGVLRPTGTVRTAAGTRDVYFGQQGVDVLIGTDSITYNNPNFSFPATIQNLSTEPLGSPDGFTPSSDSIIVFFSELPVVTSGTGTVSIENATGTNTYTASNQPYFQYPGLLPSNGTTVAITWIFNVPSTVQGFGFDVYVAAQVPDSSSAALAIPAHQFDILAVGEAHSCAIRQGNHEYCWGFNSYGEMGVGESTPVTTPRGVLGNLSIQGITSGTEFSCALATGGTYCWGDNASGELGDGTLIDRGEPVATMPPSGGGSFSHIGAGTDFSCGLASNTAYCWGDNYTGQLGDGTTNPHSTPNQVSGAGSFTSLAVGAFHACALSGGTAYCWGANADGELGTGNNTSSSSPVAVNAPSTTFTSLAAGTNFTCGLDTSGNAWCWGANVYGSLGSGSMGASVNIPQLVTGRHTFSQLTAGAYHACGIAADGIYCWGSNSTGQLGNGTTTDNATPQPVLIPVPSPVTAIGAGFGHTCVLVQTGAAYCWGDNSSGQIGDGTFTQRASPTAVSLP